MKTLSIIIPAYNEHRTIDEIVRRVEAIQLPEDFKKEIVIVDDASTDGTTEKVRALAAKHVAVFHEVNKGKGASVRDGLLRSTGDVVVIQDADLECDPEDIKELLRPILEDKADVVFGSRFLSVGSHRVVYFWKYVTNTILTTYSNMLTNLRLTDMETCYKMFTREVVDSIKHRLTSDRFGIEPEITARIKKYRVYEVPVSYNFRSRVEGKKINWKDGVAALWHITRSNLFS